MLPSKERESEEEEEEKEETLKTAYEMDSKLPLISNRISRRLEAPCVQVADTVTCVD